MFAPQNRRYISHAGISLAGVQYDNEGLIAVAPVT